MDVGIGFESGKLAGEEGDVPDYEKDGSTLIAPDADGSESCFGALQRPVLVSRQCGKESKTTQHYYSSKNPTSVATLYKKEKA